MEKHQAETTTRKDMGCEDNGASVVIGTLGTATSKLKAWLQEIPGTTSGISIQKSTLLGRAKILRRTLKLPGLWKRTQSSRSHCPGRVRTQFLFSVGPGWTCISTSIISATEPAAIINPFCQGPILIWVHILVHTFTHKTLYSRDFRWWPDGVDVCARAPDL